MEEHLYTASEAAERLGVPPRRVKYYSGLGLVPGIRRNAQGHRLLTEEQLSQIGTLLWLRRCGFRLKKVRQYAALQRQGPATLTRRIGVLGTLRRQLWQQYEELQAQIDFLERQSAWLEAERDGTDLSA